MNIWQRIFGPVVFGDTGERLVKLPADLVDAVREMTDNPGEYIQEAVRQRMRRAGQ
jgi:hypothetical protein